MSICHNVSCFYYTQYWYSGLNIIFLIFLILLIIHNLIYNFKEAEGDLFQIIKDNLGIDLKPIIDNDSARFSEECRDECFTEKGKGKQGNF